MEAPEDFELEEDDEMPALDDASEQSRLFGGKEEEDEEEEHECPRCHHKW